MGQFSIMWCLVFACAAICKSRMALVAENLCLRQQLVFRKRHQVRPRSRDEDRHFPGLDSPARAEAMDIDGVKRETLKLFVLDREFNPE